MTTYATATAPRPTTTRTGGDQVDRTTGRLLAAGLVAVVLLQRVGLPAGEFVVSVTLVVGLGLGVWLLVTGRGGLDRSLVGWYALAVAACGVAATVSGWSAAGSMESYLLLAVVYLPWLVRVRAPARAAGFATVETTFVRLMCVLAVVAIVQLVLQLSGRWAYTDLLQSWLPGNLLIPLYNPSIPVEYGSDIVKSQAFVFLEPSFLCQFLALAAIVALLRRAPWWQIALLVGAMFTTFSGTGFLLLGAGLLAMVVRRPAALLRPVVGVTVLAGLVLLGTTTVFDPLIARLSEVDSATSSLGLRFRLPYELVADGLASEPVRYVVGAGPGAAERLLESIREGVGLAVVYTIIPKLVFEYGLVTGGLFVLFIALALFRRAFVPVLPATLAVMLFLLSGSLLQPHTLMLAWLLLIVWRRGPGPEDEPGPDRAAKAT